MTTTAVVILNYNGENYLKQFLPAVLKFSAEAEIIVAENKSTDASLEILARDFPQVTIIELSENHGYAGGYNKAIEQIDSEYIVLLNSDIEVTRNWLVPMIDFLDRNPDYAACQPKIKDYNHKERGKCRQKYCCFASPI